MRVLVTGASGFIGSHIVERLLARRGRGSRGAPARRRPRTRPTLWLPIKPLAPVTRALIADLL